MALLGVMAFPAVSEAKHKDKQKTVAYATRYDRGRTAYYSHPHTSFALSFGTGYAGPGYYYGPPGAAYYYERPYVRYYRNRYDVPRSYWGSGWGNSYSGNSTDAAVQRALQRHGYYRGPIDGDIGPGTRRAIARFEADNGLPVRGYVNRTLINALGL